MASLFDQPAASLVALGLVIVTCACLLIASAGVWKGRSRPDVMYIGVPSTMIQSAASVLWIVSHAAAAGHLPLVECHEWALLVAWAASACLAAALIHHLGALVRAFSASPGFFPYLGWVSLLPFVAVALVAGLGGSLEINISECTLTAHGRTMVAACAGEQAILLLGLIHESRSFRPPYGSGRMLFGAWCLGVVSATFVALLVARGSDPEATRVVETCCLCLCLVVCFVARAGRAVCASVCCRHDPVEFLPLLAVPTYFGERGEEPRSGDADPALFTQWVVGECPGMVYAYKGLWETYTCSRAEGCSDEIAASGGVCVWLGTGARARGSEGERKRGHGDASLRTIVLGRAYDDPLPGTDISRFTNELVRLGVLGPEDRTQWSLVHRSLLRSLTRGVGGGKRVRHRGEDPSAVPHNIHTNSLRSVAVENMLRAYLPAAGEATAFTCMVYMTRRMVILHDVVFRAKAIAERQAMHRSMWETVYSLRMAGLIPRRWGRSDFLRCAPR